MVDELKFSKLEKISAVENPKISIIIPAYNVEGFIDNCLFSLIEQSVKDIEIIVVNDGSTDDTEKVVSLFCQHDNRIKLLNQENQKAGAARNNALKHARGKYIAYLDSDDTINKDTLAALLETIETNNSDIVICGAKTLKNGKLRTGFYSVEKIPKKLKNKNLSHDIIKKNIFKFPSIAWAKMYRREFLLENDIKFQSGCIGEDQIFFVSSMLLAKKVFVLDKNYYVYCRDRESAATFSKKKKDSSAILNFYAIEEFLNTHNSFKNLEFKILDKYFKKVISTYPKCTDEHKPIYYKDLEDLFEHIKTTYPKYYWKNIKINPDDKYLLLKIKLFWSKILPNKGKNHG